VKRAQEIEGVLGSRMTGQGFGGCTYTFINEKAIEEYRRRLDDYERIFGFHPLTYEVRIAGSARLVPAAKISPPSVQIPENQQSGESFPLDRR